MENKGSTTANKSVSFVVTDNLGLTKLHTTGDLIKTFTVTGNDALTELDMTGVKTQGTDTTGAAVNLWDNGLTAVKSTDNTDAETATSTTGADGGSADVGTTDDGVSGMDTMKIYLTAIAADVKTTAQVNFDTVSTFDDSETSTTATTLNTLGSTASSATTNDATVLKMTPAVANDAAGAKSATTAKRGFQLDWAESGAVNLTVNSVLLFDTTVAGAGTSLTLGNANKDLQISAIKSAVNLERATAAGVVLDAKRGYGSSGTVSLLSYGSGGSTATVLGERYGSTSANAAAVSSTNYGFGLDDLITFSVGANSITISMTGVGETTTALADIGDGIVTGWATKYGRAGTASASALATVTDTDGVLSITMLQVDSGGYDQLISLSVSQGSGTASDASTNSNNLDWQIGGAAVSLTDDNKTDDTDIIVTIASNVAGVAENSISTLTTTGAASKVTWVEMTSAYTENTTFAATYANTQVERTDVRTAEVSVAAATTNAVAAVKFNRVTWLG
jgi:hypothetical protein